VQNLVELGISRMILLFNGNWWHIWEFRGGMGEGRRLKWKNEGVENINRQLVVEVEKVYGAR
jgi:hypothetical protein